MRRSILSFVVLVAATLMSVNAHAQLASKLPPINVKEYRLKNGLRVVHHVDRSTPVVTVGIMYRVGSKNEVAGRTGFAHLFEHMMFQGSQNYDADYFTPLAEAGGTINGNTTVDRTFYYETVPSNFLELALYMEADRMGGLLPAMTQEKLDNQRDVVKNERRQSYDNQPYGTASEKIAAIMYPTTHPYNWTTIGSLQDLQAASMEDVKAFFRQYYVPNNADLIISGDFNEAQAKKWVEKYFGKITRGGSVMRPSPVQPKLDQVIRSVVEDPLAPSPRRYMVWHGVRAYEADQAPLSVLASILSSGRGSRLQNNLLYSKELVSQVGAFNNSGEIGGTFQITATARPNRSMEDIEQEINKEIERIKKEPPTELEMSRAKNAIEAQAIFGLQTVLGKTNRLADYGRLVGQHNYFQADLDRYARVTPADVQRVANQYLTANHLILTYMPKPGSTRRATEADTPTSVASSKKDQSKIDAQSAKLPKSGPNPKFALPAIEKTRLSNGLEVWMVEQRELPMVSMNLVLKTGQTNEPDNRRGVAGLTTALLDDGTKTRSAVDIANGLQSIGANMGVGGGWDSTNVTLTTLTKNLDQALDIYADVIQNPTFSEREFTSFRDRQIIGLRQQKANANSVANTVYNKVLYGDHPYGRDNTEASLRAIGRDDLVRYYESTFRPNNAVLIVVGNYDKTMMRSKLETAFAGWKPGEITSRTLPTTKSLDKTAVYLVDRPNSTQSIVGIGSIGIDRASQDYFPVLLMNNILGGGITGRISMNLREDKGYTYGANSSFTFRRGPGPFRAGGAMQTAVTKESVAELMKELRGIRGEIPITQKELDYYKQRLIRLYPAQFETVGAISDQLANLVTYGLPDTYFNDYMAKVNAVTLDDVNRVARQYLDPSKMAIVIVGDRKVIEPGLRELGFPINVLDADGNPVTQ
jgi:zinc protease